MVSNLRFHDIPLIEKLQEIKIRAKALVTNATPVLTPTEETLWLGLSDCIDEFELEFENE